MSGENTITSEEIKKFFELSPDLIAIVDSEGRFTYLSSNWKKKLGYPLQKMLGQPFLTFIHPDDLERTLKEAEACLNRKTPNSFINRYIHKDGTPIWLEWRSSYDHDSQTFYCIVREISEQKKMSEEVGKLTRYRQEHSILEVIRNMLQESSSDIYSDLFNVGAHAEVLEMSISKNFQQRDSILPKEQLLKHITEIRSAITRLNKIFMGLNRVSSNESLQENGLISLNEVLNDIIVITKNKLNNYNITLKKPETSADSQVQFQRVKLCQLLHQIIDEAIQEIKTNLGSQAKKEIQIHIDKTRAHTQIILDIPIAQKDELNKVKRSVIEDKNKLVQTRVTQTHTQKIITLENA